MDCAPRELTMATGKNDGRVIWITGLSGAGKTTLARALAARLPHAVLLDGDDLRAVLGATASGFDRSSRLALAQTYARFCKLLADQGHTVVIATISLFHEIHAWNRENLPGYLEVFLDVPEAVRRRRDPKGLYAAEQNGTVRHMAGAETTVDIPRSPDLILPTAELPLEDCAARVMRCLQDRENRSL